MEGHLTESRIETDGTDELPILSDEAILRFRVAPAATPEAPETAAQAPDAAESERKAPDNEAEAAESRPDSAENDSEADEREHDGAGQPLEALETLRATLADSEKRWQALEQRLKSQDRAIAELRRALDRPAGPAAAVRTEPAKAPASAPRPTAAGPVMRDAAAEDRGSGGQRELLDRIAALETYIAGRADRWREMELQVEAKSTRIAELETELDQRIAREQRLEERLQDYGGRAEALRHKLRRMQRRLEPAGTSRPGLAPDPTSELAGPAGEVASIVFERAAESDTTDPGDAPELICLSSDIGERYVMNKEAITIGRAADCDIQISAGFVSRQHATIRREDTDMYIEDESSTNGVYVNAERVRRKALADGDEITIGQSRFRFVSSHPSH